MYTPEEIPEISIVLFIEEKRWLNTFLPKTLNMFTVFASVLEVVTVKTIPFYRVWIYIKSINFIVIR